MNRDDHRPPNFRAFHQSIAAELKTAKNRVRNLIQGRHWQTDGEHKEAVLRSVIRRHLPGSMAMGTGFVVAQHEVSTQVDILIIDGDSPVLFREGDLMIVTPDAVRGIVEVKTRLDAAKCKEALEKLGHIAAMCGRNQHAEVWTGLFVYEVGHVDDRAVLKALAGAERNTRGRVNCVSSGPTRFVRYWNTEPGTTRPIATGLWRSYEMDGLAPSYFVGNLMAAARSK